MNDPALVLRQDRAPPRRRPSRDAESAEKIVLRVNAAQPTEKSGFGRENPRKSKTIQLPGAGGLRPGGLASKKTQMARPGNAKDQRSDEVRQHPARG
jgi:hypothetical protein